MNSGQPCRPCRELCSFIPGRGSFGDIPGDEITVSPPSPIVEPLERPWSSSIGYRKSGSRITTSIDTITVSQFNKVLWFLHISTGVSRAFFETGALNRYSSNAAQDLITRSMYLRPCISQESFDCQHAHVLRRYMVLITRVDPVSYGTAISGSLLLCWRTFGSEYH